MLTSASRSKGPVGVSPTSRAARGAESGSNSSGVTAGSPWKLVSPQTRSSHGAMVTQSWRSPDQVRNRRGTSKLARTSSLSKWMVIGVTPVQAEWDSRAHTSAPSPRVPSVGTSAASSTDCPSRSPVPGVMVISGAGSKAIGSSKATASSVATAGATGGVVAGGIVPVPSPIGATSGAKSPLPELEVPPLRDPDPDPWSAPWMTQRTASTTATRRTIVPANFSSLARNPRSAATGSWTARRRSIGDRERR